MGLLPYELGKMKTGSLTQERLKAVVKYEPETGEFRWMHPAGRFGRIPAGSIAGTLNKEGYRYIRIDGVHYRACRLAWLYMTGAWPAMQVDHINRQTDDDRFGNLRECNQSQNKSNSRIYRNNTSGHPGVRYDSSKSRARYRALVTKDGEMHHIGWFLTIEEAIKARDDAARRLHGDFAANLKEAA